jgi:isoleucyl-tRNA synthetase
MDPRDQYMLVRTAEMADRFRAFYDEMLFHRVYHDLNTFCAVDLSSIYFDLIKDRLYTFAPNSQARRSAQTAVWRIAEAMVRLVAPIMSFTADEIWEYLPKVDGRLESVHMALFPANEDVLGEMVSPEKMALCSSTWATLMSVREEALKALEVARQNKEIGSALEAKLKLSASEPLYSVLAAHLPQLRALLIVSGVSLEQKSTNGSGAVAVQVSRADGQKCERCWNYSVHVGENKDYPTICERCTAALEEIAKV